jgi:hypothetical protein
VDLIENISESSVKYKKKYATVVIRELMQIVSCFYFSSKEMFPFVFSGTESRRFFAA